MLVFQKGKIEEPSHYYDKVTKKKWGRIAGGIGWPQEGLSGVGLIIGEDLGDPANYEVLSLTQEYNAGVLLENCKSLELEFPVKGWYGCIGDRTMMILLHEFNKGKFPEDKLRFQVGPLSGEANNSGFYLPKVIDLGVDGRLNAVAAPVLLEELKNDESWPETHLNMNIAKYPILAALCYPLAWFLMYGGGVVKPLKRDYLKQYGKSAWQL